MLIRTRFLQFLLSPITGDHITVAMLYCDATSIRSAVSLRNMPRKVPGLHDTVRAIVAGALLRGDIDDPPGQHDATLRWSPVRHSQTAFPEQDFEQLKRLVGLE